MFGDGRNVKSMVYVENVAKFLAKCAGEKPGVHVYNYIDKPDLSMNQLVQITRKTLFGKPGVGLRMPGFLGVTIGIVFDLLAWLLREALPVSSIRVKIHGDNPVQFLWWYQKPAMRHRYTYFGVAARENFAI